MRDFYATSEPTPLWGVSRPQGLDQADGLRRLFAGQKPRRILPLAANPFVPFSGVVIERLTHALAAAGRHALVVDAADSAPEPVELAQVDLAAAMEPLGEHVTYLAARGLPMAHVDTRGSASGLIDTVIDAAPQADVLVLHANPGDLGRMFQRRAARPVVIGADHPGSIKHAYAAVKLLAQRCGLMTFDLLLAADPRSPRLPHIVESLSSCADGFLGSLLHRWAVVDPASALQAPPTRRMQDLVAAQMALDTDLVAAPHAPTWDAQRHA